MATNSAPSRGLGPGPSKSRGRLRQTARNVQAGRRRNQRAKAQSKPKPQPKTNAQVRADQAKQARVQAGKGAGQVLRRFATPLGDAAWSVGGGATNMESPTDIEGFSEGAVDSGSLTGLVGQEIGRGAAAMQGYTTPEDRAQFEENQRRSRGTTDPNAGNDEAPRLRQRLNEQRAQLAELDDKTGPLANQLMVGIDTTRAQLRRRGSQPASASGDSTAVRETETGTTPAQEDVPTAEEVEAATTLGAEDPSEITWTDRNGRIRVQRERPTTMGPEGTTIDRARVGTPEAAQLQAEAMAPGLSGVPEEEQQITRIQDDSGTGVVRSQAGAFQGGGTVSFLGGEDSDGSVAAAAAPVDTQGLHEARMAALRRGEDVPGVGGGESRRERLRREIRQTRGLDQSFSSMLAEGARRRAARDELDTMNAARLRRQDNQAAMARAQLGRQPTALELAEYQSDQREQRRENERADREEYRTMIDRMYDPETEEGRTQRNRLEGVIQRSGWSRSPENLRMADDVMRVGDALNNAIQNENEFQIADLWGGGPDSPLSNVPAIPFSTVANFFGVAGQRPSSAKTIQDELARILEMTHTRTDDDVIWDDRVVDVGGTEIELRDIPSGIRALIDNIRARAGQDGLYNPDAERTD